MTRISNGNVISASEQAKLDREQVTRTSNKAERSGSVDFSDNGQCGSKNPCIFGIHNPKFRQDETKTI